MYRLRHDKAGFQCGARIAISWKKMVIVLLPLSLQTTLISNGYGLSIAFVF